MNSEITIVYEWSEDGWWVAEVAEVPGAISQGKTKAEAKANVIEALTLLLEARRDLARQQSQGAGNIESVRFTN